MNEKQLHRHGIAISFVKYTRQNICDQQVTFKKLKSKGTSKRYKIFLMGICPEPLEKYKMTYCISARTSNANYTLISFGSLT